MYSCPPSITAIPPSPQDSPIIPLVYSSSPSITVTPPKSSVYSSPFFRVLQSSLHYSQSPKFRIIPFSFLWCTQVTLQPLRNESPAYPCPPISVFHSSFRTSHSLYAPSIPLSSLHCTPVLPPLKPLPKSPQYTLVLPLVYSSPATNGCHMWCPGL